MIDNQNGDDSKHLKWCSVRYRIFFDAPGVYLILKTRDVVLIVRQFLKRGGTSFKTRGNIHKKFENPIIFSFKTTIILTAIILYGYCYGM